ncbi:indole-3-glycerol phosphate synthase TrpC [Corticicoccus populi]|uniref:Indole-3-glycerol phosphate synthase n=1 Tax=Corticicoccus populi TaxID=1812821 RepID=A0ABW5WV29_9STAP
MTILDDIVEVKKRQLESYPEEIKTIERTPVPFKVKAEADGTLGIISEIKRASPSKGDINPGISPVFQAEQYVSGGTTAISVLTETDYFKGSLDDLQAVKQAVDVPVLNKDFIIDQRQIAKAYNHGADIILLIAAILSDEEMKSLYDYASELNLECIVEVHDEEEMKRALKLQPEIIGINNRNLKTFEVDLKTTETLLEKYNHPGILFIGESGIKTESDAVRMSKAGAGCLLVGETLMRDNTPAEVIRKLKVAKHD